MRRLPDYKGPLILLLLLSATFGSSAYADTATDIQAKIDAQTDKILQLEKEIAQYEASLTEIGKNKTSLQNEVTRLDTSRKKIGTQITVTNDRIVTATLQLSDLGTQITDKQTRIDIGRKGLASSLRSLNNINNQTIVEQYLSHDTLSDAWADSDRLFTLQQHISDEMSDLQQTKQVLTVHRDDVAKQKAELASLQAELKGQKSILDQNRTEQANLLSQTKNKESEFQKILHDKQAAKIQFEQELNQYESQLKFTLNPSTIPASGQGILSFPIDPTFMSKCAGRQSVFGNVYCITQYFGNTAFAKSGAYNGSGHNGVDFGVPDGTKIVSALGGTVTATGNTDAYPGCYSYGKWVLIKHDNGLSTLYGHLSYIGVSQGTSVSTGTMIGYSGRTGYATGPHLHFTVYATDGVKLVTLGSVKAKTNCANATVPVAATSAYLNPMQYL